MERYLGELLVSIVRGGVSEFPHESFMTLPPSLSMFTPRSLALKYIVPFASLYKGDRCKGRWDALYILVTERRARLT